MAQFVGNDKTKTEGEQKNSPPDETLATAPSYEIPTDKIFDPLRKAMKAASKLLDGAGLSAITLHVDVGSFLEHPEYLSKNAKNKVGKPGKATFLSRLGAYFKSSTSKKSLCDPKGDKAAILTKVKRLIVRVDSTNSQKSSTGPTAYDFADCVLEKGGDLVCLVNLDKAEVSVTGFDLKIHAALGAEPVKSKAQLYREKQDAEREKKDAALKDSKAKLNAAREKNSLAAAASVEARNAAIQAKEAALASKIAEGKEKNQAHAQRVDARETKQAADRAASRAVAATKATEHLAKIKAKENALAARIREGFEKNKIHSAKVLARSQAMEEKKQQAKKRMAAAHAERKAAQQAAKAKAAQALQEYKQTCADLKEARVAGEKAEIQRLEAQRAANERRREEMKETQRLANIEYRKKQDAIKAENSSRSKQRMEEQRAREQDRADAKARMDERARVQKEQDNERNMEAAAALAEYKRCNSERKAAIASGNIEKAKKMEELAAKNELAREERRAQAKRDSEAYYSSLSAYKEDNLKRKKAAAERGAALDKAKEEAQLRMEAASQERKAMDKQRNKEAAEALAEYHRLNLERKAAIASGDAEKVKQMEELAAKNELAREERRAQAKRDSEAYHKTLEAYKAANVERSAQRAEEHQSREEERIAAKKRMDARSAKFAARDQERKKLAAASLAEYKQNCAEAKQAREAGDMAKAVALEQLAKENESRRKKRKEEADQENTAYQQQLADYKQDCAERKAQSQAFQDQRSADREAAASRNLERREQITASRKEIVAAKELAAATKSEAREARLQAFKDAQHEVKALAAELKAAQAEEMIAQLEAATEAMEAEAVEMEAMEAEVEETNDGSAMWATEKSEESSSPSASPSALSAPPAAVHPDGYPDDGEKVQEMRDAIALFKALYAKDRKRKNPETRKAQNDKDKLVRWVKSNVRTYAEAQQDILDAEYKRQKQAERNARNEAINKKLADDKAAREAGWAAADAKSIADNEAVAKKSQDKQEIAHLRGSNGNFNGKDRSRSHCNYILEMAQKYCQGMPGVQVQEMEMRILQSIEECGGGYAGFDTYKSTIFKEMMSEKKRKQSEKKEAELRANLSTEMDRIVQVVSRSFGGGMSIKLNVESFEKSEEFLALNTSEQLHVHYFASTSMLDLCLTDAFTESWNGGGVLLSSGVESKLSGGSMVGLCGFPEAVEHMKTVFSSIVVQVHPKSDLAKSVHVELDGKVLEVHVNLSPLVEIVRSSSVDARMIAQMQESSYCREEGGIIALLGAQDKRDLGEFGSYFLQNIYNILFDGGKSEVSKETMIQALQPYYELSQRHNSNDPTPLAAKHFENIRPAVEVALAPGLRKVRQKAVIEECNAKMAAAAISGMPAAEIDWSFLDAGVFATNTEYVTYARNCLSKTMELLYNKAWKSVPYPLCGESLHQLQEVVPELKNALKKTKKIVVAFTNRQPATNIASIGAEVEAIFATGGKSSEMDAARGQHGMYVKNLDVVMQSDGTLKLTMDAMERHPAGAGRNVLMCLCPSAALDQVKKYVAGVLICKKWRDSCRVKFEKRRDTVTNPKKRAVKAEWERVKKLYEEGRLEGGRKVYDKRKEEGENQLFVLDQQLERFRVDTVEETKVSGQKEIEQAGAARYVQMNLFGFFVAHQGTVQSKPASQYIAYDKSLDWSAERH